MDGIDYSEKIRLVVARLPDGYKDVTLAEAVIKVMAIEKVRHDMNVGIVRAEAPSLTTRKQIAAIFERADFPRKDP